MSTQSCTQDPPATSQHDTRRAPRPHRGQPPWHRTAAIAIGAVAAVKDLQRQAGLPQTGTMNPPPRPPWPATWPTATTRWPANHPHHPHHVPTAAPAAPPERVDGTWGRLEPHQRHIDPIRPGVTGPTGAGGMLWSTCDVTAGTAGSFGTSTAGLIRWLQPAGAELDLTCFKLPALTVWTRTG